MVYFNHFLKQKSVYFFLFFSLISTIPSSNAQLFVNEIMYDPPDGNEWIELYNDYPFSINLNSWNLTDNLKTDSFTCCFFSPNCSLIIPPQSYVLITDQKTTLYNSTLYNSPLSNFLNVCVDDNDIGNGLGNTGDTINLSNKTTQTLVTYSSNQGANGNNKTLERKSDNTWDESIVNFGTPGKKNSIYDLISEYQALEITELLPDPFDSDEAQKPNGEWIEMYNTGKNTLDLKGLFFKDSKNTSKLIIADTSINEASGTLICPSCYKVIYRNGDSDFSLNNDYDEISLWYKSTLLDSISFSGSTEGMSWSRVNDLWIQTNPTPNQENELTDSCDWKLSIETPTSIFQDNPSFTLEAKRLNGFAQNITVKGTITDLDNNLISSYTPWSQKAVTTSTSTSYSPSLAPGTYQLSFYYENLTCADSNLNNNNISTLIAINFPTQQNTSTINSLTTNNNNKFQWGDEISVSLSLFKGDTSKQKIELWVEKDSKKVSTTTSLNLLTRFQNYSLSIPIQLNSNCNKKNQDGPAALIIEGLGLHVEKGITIEDSNEDNCESTSLSSSSVSPTSSSTSSASTQSSSHKKRSPSYQLIETPSTIQAGDALRIKVQIDNPSGTHNFQLTSDLFNNKKCLTCKENDSLLSSSSKVSLKEDEIKVVDSLLLIPSSISKGEYQLKVKIIKDNQKTVHQLTSPIYLKDQTLLLSTSQDIFSSQSLSSRQLPTQIVSSSNAPLQEESPPENQITGFVAYESNAQKTKKTIPYFLIITLALLSVLLVIRNGKA